ncbi:MAG TPA: nuclear transport factor 2 family protein [Terriglobales bacterium]|jgi:ketosteroid isomerase-like protein|nr:nuclear transport factor 2 family protein [Terriglobales bacterium]
MRTRLSLLAAALLLSAGLPSFSGAQQSSGPSSRILALETRLNDAYKQRDIAALNSLMADDFIITVEDGTTFSKTGYIAHIGEPGTRVEISEVSDAKVRLHGSTAVVTGAYREKGTSHGKPYEYHDRFTDVWMELGGKWQLIASHYSIPVKD